MRKLLLILFACFFMASFAVADSNYTSENAVNLGPNMGGEGITPPVEIVKVSVGSEDNVIVGTVMAWNLDQATDGSGLGFLVDLCRRDFSTDVGTVTSRGLGPYAGVMVTIASHDKANTDAGGPGGITFDATDVRGSGGAIGYMAIRGYVDALVKDAKVSLGEHLIIYGASNIGFFATKTTGAGTGTRSLSEDIGYLLEDPSADGLARVWLR